MTLCRSAVIGDRRDPGTRTVLEHLRCFGGIETAGPDGAYAEPPSARIAARPASSRATGTRNGEQET